MQSNETKTVPLQDVTGEHVDHDAQTYLRVAETVLADALTPLKAREIVDRGIERGLFGDHVLSRTPEKSMQARLSMDILKLRDNSRFVRTGRGRFTLRSTLQANAPLTGVNEATHSGHPHEYIPERRILRTPKEEVLCVPENSFSGTLTFQGIDADATPILAQLLGERNVLYVPRSEAESRNDAKQFVTYVLVQCGQRLLFFKRSYLSRAAEFLRGSKCIGFGGHVSAADIDILSRADRGLSACARRELAEELHLGAARPGSPPTASSADYAVNYAALPRAPSRATIKLFQEAALERLGVLNDDSSEVGRRHVAVIYRLWLPDWHVARQLQKGDSSIKGLGWIDLSRDKVDISEFEYWSQLCLRKFYPSTPITRAGFKILNRSKLTRDRLVIVAGRIGSGKTETASYLSQKLGCPLIKSGELVRDLMGSPSIEQIGRREFQARAHQYINTTDGPDRLAAAIETCVSETGAQRCIIDGIRHLVTFERLERLFDGSVGLIFVNTPPDVAYDMYRSREAQTTLTFSYREYLEIYDAPVEAEIPSLGRRAHIVINNAFGIETFRRTLDDLAGQFGNSEAEHLQPTGRGKAQVRY
jgi:predicted NUDIX family phosphoesterase/adenylate kinase family enzyme